MSRTLALLDLENLWLSLRTLLRRELDVEEILQATGEQDALLTVRAYADFRIVPGGLAHALQACDIDSIHVPGRSRERQSRDSADFCIASDIVDAALRRPEVSTIVLGSGDHAFVPALARARRLGKKIRVIAVPGSISQELARLAGENLVLLTGGRPIGRRGESSALLPPAIPSGRQALMPIID